MGYIVDIYVCICICFHTHKIIYLDIYDSFFYHLVNIQYFNLIISTVKRNFLSSSINP